MELVLGFQLEEMVRFPKQQRTLISRASYLCIAPRAKIIFKKKKVHNSILHIFYELKKCITLFFMISNNYSFFLFRRNICCIFQSEPCEDCNICNDIRPGSCSSW